MNFKDLTIEQKFSLLNARATKLHCHNNSDDCINVVINNLMDDSSLMFQAFFVYVDVSVYPPKLNLFDKKSDYVAEGKTLHETLDDLWENFEAQESSLEKDRSRFVESVGFCD
jgi:hypothetical protein